VGSFHRNRVVICTLSGWTQEKELVLKMYHSSRKTLLAIIAQSIVLIFSQSAFAQFPTPTPEPPLTSQELVRLVYQLPKNPEMHDDVVEAIRKRGIGFALTDGMRTLVAAKSGNDSTLRRTLEEADRRRANPKASVLPTEIEGNELWRLTKNVTLAAAGAMPDFIVHQLIKRSQAHGGTGNWLPLDTLTIGVSYRQNVGEQYKVLAINGVPSPQAKEGSEYDKDIPGGASSTGEYVTGLASLFKEESHTTYRVVDTDVLRGHASVVYEYEIQKPYSSLELKAGQGQVANVGSRGRVWIDREQYRVLRFEQIATDIPPDFPITAASSLVDYDWVPINEHPYLLPAHADILISMLGPGGRGPQKVDSRNDIRFRGYQKFGAEVKIIDDIDDEVLPEKPEKTEKPKKPDQP
jgi:hypothetical protein